MTLDRRSAAGHRAHRAAIAAALALAPVLGVVAFTTASAPPAAASADVPTFPVLVANSQSGTVSDVGPAGTTTLDVGSDPDGVAITPDGTYAYVANFFSTSVSVVDTADTADPTVSTTVLDVGSGPSGVAITPDGKYAYVVDDKAASVSVIDTADTASPSVSATTLDVGNGPEDLAITPDGKYAYVANVSSGTVSVIDTADTADPSVSGTALDVGSNPIAVAITPDGQYAYVANQSGTVSVIDTADTADPTLSSTTLTVGNIPWSVAITPNGQYAYVANDGSTTVSVIDTADTTHPNVSATTLTVGESPQAVAITPDGQYAYVANDGSTTVSVIDTASTAAPTVSTTTLTVDTNPDAVAVVPDQAPVAAISTTPAPAGRATSFTATGSTVAYGTIASYAWTFGDGSAPVTTTTDTTTHTYAGTGTYTASVTETDSAGTSTTQVFTGQTVSDNGGPSAVASTSVTVAATTGPPPTTTGPTTPAPPPAPTGTTSHTSCAVASGTCSAANDTVAVTASPGPGALTVSQYASDPEGAPSFSSTGEYFDVEIASGSSFSTVTVKDCNLSSGTKLYWWNAPTSRFEAVTPVTGPTGTPPCLTATLSSTSSPTLTQLTGTVFAVGTPAPTSTTTTRVAGATADATAAAELTRAFPSTKGVCPVSRAAVVATTAEYNDALSSQFLAQSLTTGTLLTPTESLSSVTATTLEDEGITTVYVVGGPLAVTTTVAKAIEALTADACGGKTPSGKITVTRIAGTTQYGTAEAIAEHVGTAASLAFPGAYATTNASGGTGKFNDTAGLGSAAPAGALPTAILASGVEFQDAQAASVVSYHTKLPLLLTPATTLSTTAVAAIEKLGIKQVVLMGGTLAITNTVEATLVAKTGVTVLRVAGGDYTDTAVELARFEAAAKTTGLTWTPGHKVLVARGNGFTDGIAGAVLDSPLNTATGAKGTARPLLLTETPSVVGTYLATFLATTGAKGIDGTAAKTLTSFTVLGGPLALTTAVVTQMETDLKG